MEQACASCGASEASLTPVHRIYVEHDVSAPEPTVTELEEIELWCAACTANYPHRPLT